LLHPARIPLKKVAIGRVFVGLGLDLAG